MTPANKGSHLHLIITHSTRCPCHIPGPATGRLPYRAQGLFSEDALGSARTLAVDQRMPVIKPQKALWPSDLDATVVSRAASSEGAEGCPCEDKEKGWNHQDHVILMKIPYVQIPAGLSKRPYGRPEHPIFTVSARMPLRGSMAEDCSADH